MNIPNKTEADRKYEKLKGKLSFSPSSYEKFKKCPHQYELYMCGELPYTAGPAAATGTACHSYFEHLVQHGKPSDDLAAKFIEEATSGLAPAQALEAQRKYFELIPKFEGVDVSFMQGGEFEKTIKVDMGEFLLNCRCDFVHKTKGIVLDFKTTTSTEDYSPDQLNIYVMGLAKLGYQITKEAFVTLPDLSMDQREPNPDEAYTTLKTASDIIHEYAKLDRGSWIRTPSSRNCKYCNANCQQCEHSKRKHVSTLF